MKSGVVALLVSNLLLFVASIMVGSLGSNVLDPEVLRVALDVRLPRALGAVLCGSSLAIVGLALQTMFRNPLADPYVLGVANGSLFFASLAFYLSVQFELALGMPLYMLCSFLGSMAVLAILLAVSPRLGVVQVLLSGVALGFLFGALTQILISLMEFEKAGMFMANILGSLSGITMKDVAYLLACFTAGLSMAVLVGRGLSALEVGEEQAEALGANVRTVKLFTVCMAGILTGSVVSTTGVIGFVGLVAPHISRALLKTSRYDCNVLTTTLIGSFLLLASDLANRVIPPAELPITAITSIFGVPFILHVLAKRLWM